MKKFFVSQWVFIVIAIVIGIFLNQKNCISDELCDPDPVYGGCSSNCEFGTASEWLWKSLGVWLLMNVGFIIGKENLKKQENLKEFLARAGLKTSTRQITEEWKEEDRENDKKIKKILKEIEHNK